MKKRVNNKVFISYNPETSDSYAKFLYKNLQKSKYSVLPHLMADEKNTLEKQISFIEKSRDFILLLSDTDLFENDPESESLKKEIAYALERGKNVIPVFIDGYELPTKESLPKSIAAIYEKNPIFCFSDQPESFLKVIYQELKAVPDNKNSKYYQIFISYRRNGSDAHARVFYEKLKGMGYQVFLDFESLFSGGFEKNILKAIDECDDFVLLLPFNGLERCSDEEDVLRKEIVRAIRGGKNIIPIFINGFTMPKKEELPPDMAALTEEHGFECSMEYFDAVFEKLLRNLDSVPRDDYLYDSIADIRKFALSLEHPYFKKWAYVKIEEFLSQNNEFFQGTNRTNPHAEDTFGISGIEFTKKSIKAITSVSDYWEDDFTMQYLEKQAKMIREGVEVHRVFVVENEKSQAAVSQMSYQHSLGINVYYIKKENEYIDPKWLAEDYLIQDDELLVEISCETHRFESQDTTSELVTMDKAKVIRKSERLQRIFERSTKFSPEDFTLVTE